MKKKYLIPQTCWETVVSEYVLAESSFNGTGVDLEDPIIVSDSDFNGMF